jgi:hypothetical protein
MHTPDHTPACRESPHFCICRHSNIISMDTAAEHAASLPERELFAEHAEGNLIAAGGWGLRQNELTVDDLPPISVARGGIKYPSAHELLPKVRAERDTALEQSRFYRRNFFFSAALCLGWMAYGVGKTLGWF